ncbi:vitamin K epoxide reductase family protein [Leptolyngbya sp. FACHB-261]|uniref:vitamin K epoxide reductase family protein n=1 Tax=Leptolyngbya sp. FACHB-261 TaxID=2692806 RepID=UPI0016853FA5|nr:vitamin K epoxide reductase family protein [Leptolyngbya sp. FACHB-261]MBD2102971.1 vitamin K epoxide reductase family protein [Leptolyngbya sp. FACHB-261]
MGRRSRQTPWIHRWSRPIIAVIAACGALLTAYLTITHFTGTQVALCTEKGSGCDVVLSSPYARLFGIPLTIFGCLGYLGLGALAVAPLLVKPEQNKDLHQKLEDITWPLLLAGATATVIFSAYLMTLLVFVFKTPCLYCISSALFMTSIFLLTIFGRYWQDVGQVLFTSSLVGVVALMGVFGFHAAASQGSMVASGSTYPAQLAQHLTQTGAKMYGAYWCPHCLEQKALFGEAAKQLDYVECDPNGENPRPQLCQAKNIQGYPTWEIKGQMIEGSQPLDKLADLSNYSGPRTGSQTATPAAVPVPTP